MRRTDTTDRPGSSLNRGPDRSRGPVRVAFLTLASVSVFVSAAAVPLSAQHEGHAMQMAADSGALAWRMPPMDANMPMLPGLERALPPVGPFLAGMGMDPSMFPEAQPSRILEAPPGDTVDLRASLVRRTLNGHTTVMYGYNGQYPGPLFKAEQGSTFVVRFVNEIELPTTVHWHGIRLDNPFDGVPGVTQDPVQRGDTFFYHVKVIDAGLYWYHPHVREDVQQDLGLYGNLLVAAPAADYYGAVHREEMLTLDDILMDDRGAIPFGKEANTHALMGRFGNVMLTNGKTEHRIEVQRGEVVRFYVTNVANSRTFNVVFGGAPTKLVASDVSRYEREGWVESVPIAPAERYTVEVRFDTPGEVAITNTIQAINHFRGEFYPHVDTLALVTVSDAPAEASVAPEWEELRTHRSVSEDIEGFREHFDRDPDRDLRLTVRVVDLPQPIMLSMAIDTLYVPPMEWNDAMPMMNWLSTANQVTWILREDATGRENMDIEWDFDVGDVVKVRIFNDPESFHPMNHPIHVHGQRFLVLSMDGVQTANHVWKDTAIVPVGSTMEILIDVTNPGEWMLHCHIAEHLHAGMMMGFTVR